MRAFARSKTSCRNFDEAAALENGLGNSDVLRSGDLHVCVLPLGQLHGLAKELHQGHIVGHGQFFLVGILEAPAQQLATDYLWRMRLPHQGAVRRAADHGLPGLRRHGLLDGGFRLHTKKRRAILAGVHDNLLNLRLGDQGPRTIVHRNELRGELSKAVAHRVLSLCTTTRVLDHRLHRPALRNVVLENAPPFLCTDNDDFLEVALKERLKRVKCDLETEQLDVLFRNLRTHALADSSREQHSTHIACTSLSTATCSQSHGRSNTPPSTTTSSHWRGTWAGHNSGGGQQSRSSSATTANPWRPSRCRLGSHSHCTSDTPESERGSVGQVLRHCGVGGGCEAEGHLHCATASCPGLG
mmetsp:Transcript_95222/g.308351  ORF Transcript_95222/g.308351 Transcript_95222/m.308351 type:complete len:356 (+) Transcript_95222:110-1177(+)